MAGAGLIALLEAAERYDAARGYKFVTHAMHCVKWCLVNECKRQASLIAVPRHLCGVPPAEGYPADVQRALDVLSLDYEFSDGDACLQSGREDAGADCLEMARLNAALARLPPRDRQAVELSLGAKLSLGQVAANLGVSKQRVQQLRARGLAKLRKLLRA